jgi:hypothetical protein
LNFSNDDNNDSNFNNESNFSNDNNNDDSNFTNDEDDNCDDNTIDCIENINRECNQEYNSPVIISQKPNFISQIVLINIWKSLIIDTKLANIYTDDRLFRVNESNESTEHSMVISLMSLNEMRKHNIINYGINVQRAGKIFIHFPLYKRSKCYHKYIAKTMCDNYPCGIIIPFLDMRAAVSMVNEYMSSNIKKNRLDKVLLHCNGDINRMLVFIGCCMIQGEIPQYEVINIMKTLNLKRSYCTYIKKYARYIQEIN